MTYNYNEWLKNGCPKIFCKCGCDGEIIVKKCHKHNGIPEYISGHTWKNKHLSEEHKQRLSEKTRGIPKSEETKQKMRNKCFTKKHRQKLSETKLNKNNPNWKGGITDHPYCEKWTEELREEIRNEYGRKCYLCGKEEKDQIKEQKEKGKRPFRLSVHHIDLDKGQGCNGKKWKLVPLCIHCHNSKKVEILNDKK